MKECSKVIYLTTLIKEQIWRHKILNKMRNARVSSDYDTCFAMIAEHSAAKMNNNFVMVSAPLLEVCFSNIEITINSLGCISISKSSIW